MSEQEQNKKINEIKRQLAQAVERIKTLELDMEPSSHITMVFDRLSDNIDVLERRIDGIDQKLDVMSNQINGVLARQEVMLERTRVLNSFSTVSCPSAITKINNLPEE